MADTETLIQNNFRTRGKRIIKVVVLDIDGVLTDGAIYVNSDGEETKKIIFEDIDAIFELKRNGITVGFISGEDSKFQEYVRHRFKPDFLLVGCKDKLTEFKKLCQKFGWDKKTVCFVGDSPKDTRLLAFLDYSFSPFDALPEVKNQSKFTLSSGRGSGVIREVAKIILENNRGSVKIDNFWQERIREHQQMINAILVDGGFINDLAKVSKVIVSSLRHGQKILVCGNGGSAADASHLATELVSRFFLERKAIPAEALTADTVTLTAIGNDYGFENIFTRQIEARGKKGDVLIVISTSGNSENVIKAVELSKELGIISIALTGRKNPNRIRELSDYNLSIPSISTPRIQEGHILIYHMMCEFIERELSLDTKHGTTK